MTPLFVFVTVVSALGGAWAVHRAAQRRRGRRERLRGSALSVPIAAPAPGTNTPAVVRLSDLPDNASGDVVDLDDACQGFGRRRLMDLGFTAGTRVAPVLTTFAGDPRAYHVRGTVIAVRRDQAAHVLVRPVAAEERGVA